MAAESGHGRAIAAVIGVAAVIVATTVIAGATAVIGRTAAIIVVVAVPARGDRDPGANDGSKGAYCCRTTAATAVVAPPGAEVSGAAGRGRQAFACGRGSGASQRRLN